MLSQRLNFPRFLINFITFAVFEFKAAIRFSAHKTILDNIIGKALPVNRLLFFLHFLNSYVYNIQKIELLLCFQLRRNVSHHLRIMNA